MRVPAPPLPRPSTSLLLARVVVLAVLPHGGQQTARRNAWAGMAADAQRSRARRDAAAAMDVAVAAASGWATESTPLSEEPARAAL